MRLTFLDVRLKALLPAKHPVDPYGGSTVRMNNDAVWSASSHSPAPGHALSPLLRVEAHRPASHGRSLS